MTSRLQSTVTDWVAAAFDVPHVEVDDYTEALLKSTLTLGLT